MKLFSQTRFTHLLIATIMMFVSIAPYFLFGLNISASSNTPIQFLALNDFHGAINGSEYLATNLDNATASFVHQQNGKRENSIRLSAGDMVGASPAISGLLRDEPTIRVLNEMDFTIGTLGNHEFDSGLAEFKRILDGRSTDQFGDIVASYPRERSKLEVVIANVVDKQTGNIPQGFAPYTIKEIANTKIGFIGIVTTKTPGLVMPNHIGDYNFLDETDTIKKYAKELRNSGVTAIVVMMHCSSDDSRTIIKTLNETDPDHSVDIVFSGHDHQRQNEVVGETLIVQARSAGRSFTNITGEIDALTGDFNGTPTAQIIDTTNEVTPNTNIKNIITDAEKRVDPIINEVIGEASESTISRTFDEMTKESPLGNLITDAQKYMALKAGYKVDFAFTNNGGIRDDLNTNLVDGKKQITWGHAQATQPFGNVMQIINMKGSDVLAVLAQQGSSFLHFSGLSYLTSGTDFVAVLPDGTLVDPTSTYCVVVNDFLYANGDNYTGFGNGKLIGVMESDTLTFVNYIKSLTENGQMVSASMEGRKKVVSQEELEKLKEDNSPVKLVIQQIEDLPTVINVRKDLHDVQISNARLAYNNLTEVQKKKIHNYPKLVTVENRLNEIKTDNIPPIITGVYDGYKGSGAVTVYYSDNVGVSSAKIITKNSIPFASGTTFNAIGTYILEVIDLNGNTTRISFEITAIDSTYNPVSDSNEELNSSANGLPKTGDGNPIIKYVVKLFILSSFILAILNVHRKFNKNGSLSTYRNRYY